MSSRRNVTLAAAVIVVLAAGDAVGAIAGASNPGPSAPLGPVTKHSGCHVRGSLPDRACTPGARFTTVATAAVCTPGYSSRVRDVTYTEKSAVYAAYGMRHHFNGENGEVDHLVSLELGGSNDQANLWPESAAGTYGAHEKDRLENELHHEVCDGALSLSRAERLVAGDWVMVYRSRFG